MQNHNQDRPIRRKRNSLNNKKIYSERRTYARSQLPQRKSNIQNVMAKVRNNQILTQQEKKDLSLFVGQKKTNQQSNFMSTHSNYDKEIFFYQIVDFFSIQHQESPNWVLEYIKKMFLQLQAQIENLQQNYKIQQEDIYKLKASFKSDRSKYQMQISRLQKKNDNNILLNQERDQKINSKWEKILENQIQQNHQTYQQMQIANAENKHTTLFYDYLFKNMINFLEQKGLWNQNFNMSNFQYTVQNMNDFEAFLNLSTSQNNEENLENQEKTKIERIYIQLQENQSKLSQLQSEVKVGRIKLKNLEMKLNSSNDQNQTIYLEVLEQRNLLREKIIILENNQKILEQKIEQDQNLLISRQEDSKFMFKEIELNLQQFYKKHIQQIQSRQKQIFRFLESNKMDFNNDNYLNFLKKASNQLQIEKSLSVAYQQIKQQYQTVSLQSYTSSVRNSQTNDQISLMTQLNKLKMENCQLQQQIQQQNQEMVQSNITNQFLKVNHNLQECKLTSNSGNVNLNIKNIFSWLLSEKEEEEDDLKSFSMYQLSIDNNLKHLQSNKKLNKKQETPKNIKYNFQKQNNLSKFILKISNLLKKFENFKIKNIYQLESKLLKTFDQIQIVKNLAQQKKNFLQKQNVLLTDQFQQNSDLKKQVKNYKKLINVLQIKDINDEQDLQRIQQILKVGDLVLKKTISYEVLKEIQDVFDFYLLKSHQIFNDCKHNDDYQKTLNKLQSNMLQYSKEKNNDQQYLSKANTNEELNSMLEKHLDIQIESYKNISSEQNVFDQQEPHTPEKYAKLNFEYKKLQEENDRLMNKFFEFQEEILSLNQKIQDKDQQIEEMQKNKNSETKAQNQKKLNELRKNLKNVRKKLEQRNFVISAFKLKHNEEKLKEKIHEILKKLDPDETHIDFSVFKSAKKKKIFDSIRQELSEINFDYFSNAEKSSVDSFNESYNQTQYKRRKKNTMQDLDKAKSENNKVVMKSRFITTFAPKRNKTKQKKERNFDAMFEDAFKDL